MVSVVGNFVCVGSELLSPLQRFVVAVHRFARAIKCTIVIFLFLSVELAADDLKCADFCKEVVEGIAGGIAPLYSIAKAFNFCRWDGCAHYASKNFNGLPSGTCTQRRPSCVHQMCGSLLTVNHAGRYAASQLTKRTEIRNGE